MGQHKRLPGTEELIFEIYRSSAEIVSYAQVAEEFMRLMRSSMVMAHAHEMAIGRKPGLLSAWQ